MTWILVHSKLELEAFFCRWFGVIGQFRPKKLISSIKAEASAADEWDLPFFKEAAKHFLDKSLYAIGLCSQIALTPLTSILLSTENHGEKKRRHIKAALSHRVNFKLHVLHSFTTAYLLYIPIAHWLLLFLQFRSP